jgi:hypothetical protein
MNDNTTVATKTSSWMIMMINRSIEELKLIMGSAKTGRLLK